MTVGSSLEWVRRIFDRESSRHGLRGEIGVASFRLAHDALLPVQQRLLEEAAAERLARLVEAGSIISIAYAYPRHAIDAIAVKRGDGYDKERWNVYAMEYRRLNDALDETAAKLADETGGTALPATVMGITSEINHVENYYSMAISHRVAAEQSGIGWRGKNELIVNPRYSCAMRLASVVTDLALERTAPTQMGCGDCRACLDTCPILGSKDRLENYREQCRRYIVYLSLDSEVCGKCVKACVNSPVFTSSKGLESSDHPIA
jgi:epoxyqueuosine reductase QueG